MNEKYKDIDKGWAWVVMVASFLSLVLNGTLLYGAGVFHVALLREYGESDTYTSFVGSLYSSLLSLTGPLSSVFINTYSCRVTLIFGGILVFIGLSGTFFSESLTFCLVTYGIIAGIGNGLCAMPPLVSVGYYFQRKRSFAIGMAVSGAGLGMFLSGPLFQSLINEYGLRGSFLILGAIGANQLVLAALMRPSTVEVWHQRYRKANLSSGKEKSSISQRLELHLFTDKMFLIILSQYLIWNIPFSILLLHLPNFAVLKGSSENDAAFLILLVGLTGIFGRALTGMSVGPHGIDPVLMNLGLTGLTGIITILFPLYSFSYAGQCLFASIFGLYIGGLTCMITPLNVELLGLSKLSTSVGIMYFVGGVGYIIGPTAAGFIIDQGGTYEVTFYVSGFLFLFASLLTILSSFWRKELKEDIIQNGSTEKIKNSTFLNQSGLLAGSMILKVDAERESLRGSMKYLHPRRAIGIRENYDSQNSLFRDIILKNRPRDRSAESSQYSLFRESTNSLHINSHLNKTEQRGKDNSESIVVPSVKVVIDKAEDTAAHGADADESTHFLKKENGVN